MLTLRVAAVTSGTAVDGTATAPRVVLADARRHVEGPQVLHTAVGVVPFVRAVGAATGGARSCWSTANASAASRSAEPSACVAIASAISPCRLSISRWPRYARRDSLLCDFRYNRASGSVVDACVSLLRRWPRKSVPSPSGGPSFG